MADLPEEVALLRIGDLRVEVVELGFEYKLSDGSVSRAPNALPYATSSTSGSLGQPASSPGLGLFCSILFEGEEQRTPVSVDGKWNCPLEFGVDGTEQDEGLVVVVKERKETNKRGVLREDEVGRVTIPLNELELMHARDHWYPLVTRTKGVTAAIRLVINYAFSRVDDLLNIFSEPAHPNTTQQKLSLSTLQYNIMRVIIALFPLFRIIKKLIDLFKWERPAASMLALLIFVSCCVFDYVASLAFALGSAHFVSQYVHHYRQKRLEQDVDADEELSKDAWKDWKAEKQRKDKGKDKGKERDKTSKQAAAAAAAKEKKTSIFTKMRRVQLISGKIADKIEPIRALWDWKDPKKSKVVMYMLLFATVLFLFVSFWFCLRYALLAVGLYLFTLAPLYTKFPRFKRRYHHSIIIKRLVNQIIPNTVAFLLVKLRLRNSPWTKKKDLRLSELGKGAVQAGYLVKLASVGNIWKRRYFVLKDTQLLYFNSSSPQEKLVAWIDLSSCGIINLENNLVKNRPYSFDLFDSNIPRHYLLAANSEREKEEWVASFSMVLSKPLLNGNGSESQASDTSASSSSSLAFAASSLATAATAAAAKRQTVLLTGTAGGEWRPTRPRSRSDVPVPTAVNGGPNGLPGDADKQSKVTLGSLTDADKAGWLQKRGKNRKAWKTRYFVLASMSLYYFKKANVDAVPVGSIPLEGAKIFTIQGLKKGQRFCLGLYARTRYYLLSARSEQERAAWLTTIKTVSGMPVTSVDVNDDSDQDSDEPHPSASSGGWVSGQVRDDKSWRGSNSAGSSTSSSSSSVPTDSRRSQRVGTLPSRGSLPVSWRSTVAYDGLSLSSQVVVGDLRENAKEGYLLRQEGKMRKSWRSRYVILAGDILYIFASSQGEDKVLDAVQLSNCSIYAVTGAIKGREHCIDIYRAQPSKHYLFGADDEKDRHEWINAIKRARGDKVVGETPEQELVRREKEAASKLMATLHWLHQLVREGKTREALRLLRDADRSLPTSAEAGAAATAAEQHTERDDVTSRDLVNAREPQAGLTLLHAAAQAGELALARELVETYKADLNKPDKQGWSPSHTAARHAQIDVFEYLIDHGASPYATAADGATPLHYLVRFFRRATTTGAAAASSTAGEAQDVEDRLLEVVQKAIALGADINAADRNGDTPLHQAAARPYFRLIKLLLENKANIALRNLRGESAVDVAVKEGHEEIVALMRAYELVANDPAFAHELRSPPASHPARVGVTRDNDGLNGDLLAVSVAHGAAEEPFKLEQQELYQGADEATEDCESVKEITVESEEEEEEESSDSDDDESESFGTESCDDRSESERDSTTKETERQNQGQDAKTSRPAEETEARSEAQPEGAPVPLPDPPTLTEASGRGRSGGSFLAAKSSGPRDPSKRATMVIGGRAASALDVRAVLSGDETRQQQETTLPPVGKPEAQPPAPMSSSRSPVGPRHAAHRANLTHKPLPPPPAAPSSVQRGDTTPSL